MPQFQAMWQMSAMTYGPFTDRDKIYNVCNIPATITTRLVERERTLDHNNIHFMIK